MSLKILKHSVRVILQSIRCTHLKTCRICAVNEQRDPILRSKGKRAADNLTYSNHPANELCYFSVPDFSQVTKFSGRTWDIRPICNYTIYWHWLKNKILWETIGMQSLEAPNILGQFNSCLCDPNSPPPETFTQGETN